MRDGALMREIVDGQDIIFNCAAQTSHPLSITDPLFDAQVNCLGNLTLLEALRESDTNGKTVVVYPSTSTVIGPAARPVIDETHVEEPLDIYSADKSVAEKYYRIYNKVHGLSSVVLRFPNLYGPYGKGSSAFGFINYFINLAWRDQDITVYGTGEQKRNVLYVEDAVEIMYQSAFNRSLIGQVCFAAHDEHLTVREIAQKIVSVFERGRVVTIDWPDERRRIEVGDAIISSAKLSGLTSWRPRFSFEEGLRETKDTMERLDRA
jgi:UDP-glucose 4-epimerase